MSNIAFVGVRSFENQRADQARGSTIQIGENLFNSASWQGRLKRVWRTIRRQPTRLVSLSTLHSVHPISSSVSEVRQYVPLSKICGSSSEGRTRDFDAEFYPLESYSKERWINVAAAWHLGKALPPVSLIQVGDSYFVEDGHHRVSVARALKHQEIEAEVKLWEK